MTARRWFVRRFRTRVRTDAFGVTWVEMPDGWWSWNNTSGVALTPERKLEFWKAAREEHAREA